MNQKQIPQHYLTFETSKSYFLAVSQLYLHCKHESVSYIYVNDAIQLAALIFLKRFSCAVFVHCIAAAVVDFLDGFVARLLKATSEMGKQLDSLADVVSFGVAPR